MWPIVASGSTDCSRLLVRDGLEEGAEIERVGPAAHHGEVGPLLLRPVGRELDPVPVGIREVDRLGDPVVRGALDRRPRARQASRRAGKLLPRRMEQGEVVEPRVPSGRAGVRVFDENEQVLAPGPECGSSASAPVGAEPDRILVEGNGAIEVGHGQLDGAEPRLRRQLRGLGLDLGHPDTSAGLRGLEMGVRRGSICSRRCSNAGGSESRSPSVSFGSSESKPGPIVAISKRTPLGSRK